MRKFNALTFLLVLLIFSPAGWAKSYFHPSIEQAFTLQSNGDVTVVEKRAFSFEGSFSWTRLSLLRKGVEDIIFEGVWDEKTGEPCPFEIERSPQEVSLRFSYQAQDEVLVFRIQYRLKGVVERFRDVAEFYWKVIEDQHARIEELSTIFVLPDKSPNLLKLFVHTQTAPGEMTFPEDYRSVHFRLENVPADTFVEARLLMDPSVFPTVPLQDELRYEAILNEEKGFVEAGNLPVRQGMVFFLLFGGLGVAYLVLFLVYYFRYGREPRSSYQREYEQEPPRSIAPCFLGVTLSQRKDFQLLSRAFLATIFDLARRGFLTVHEEEKLGLLLRRQFLSFQFTEKGEDEKEWEKELHPLEQEVLSLLKRLRASGGDSVTTEDIEKWGREMHGSKSNMFLFLENWYQELRKFVEKNYFPVLDKVSEKKRNLFIGIGFTYVVAGFLTIFAGGSSLVFLSFLLVPMIVVIILLVALAWRFLSRWTEEAALEYRRWMAFRRFLSDFSLLKEAPAQILPLWDRYLVYAIVLGVAEKLLQNLKRYVQETQIAFQGPSWYYPVHGTMAGLAHFDALSRSIENMANLGKALSTATTSGGGFSGGGGGGGGGGSSSAG